MILKSHLIRQVSSRFLSTMQRRPVLMNAFSGCLLFTTSDILAQYIEYRRRKSWQFSQPGYQSDDSFLLDHRRSLTTGALGIFFFGWYYPSAYYILDRQWPLMTTSHVVTKSLVEIFSVGIVMNATSLSARGLLVGRSLQKEVWPHVRREMPRVTFNDLKVWFPYNMIMFAFIPSYIRPTTTAVMDASWQTYISLRSHNYHGTTQLSSDLPSLKRLRS